MAGVDRSAEMVRQARRRNAGAIAASRVDLRLGSACDLPFADGAFDKVFSINAVQFWEDVSAGLGEARRVLRGGGLAAIAIQPRDPNADASTTQAWGDRLLRGMVDASFEAVRTERLATRPTPTV